MFLYHITIIGYYDIPIKWYDLLSNNVGGEIELNLDINIVKLK